MEIIFEQRPSDSPFVETIWRTQSEQDGTFISLASHHWMMVVTRRKGEVNLTVRGPETKATPAYRPDDAEHFGITFKFGTFMPILPISNLIDRQDAVLPEANGRSFWLNGSAWQFPDFENAETFVDRLVREGLIVREPVVDAALQGQMQARSLRSVQRRFLHATGLTHSAVYQIERARRAVLLLKKGVSILDTVDQVGYSDQPHLTRALKYLIGQTPVQIMRAELPLGFISGSEYSSQASIK